MKTDSRNYYIKQKIWVHFNTFGGKSKDFWWKINNSCSIYIIRYFLLRDKGLVPKRDEIRQDELEKINKFIRFDKEITLDNDVGKLESRVKKSGLGKYCHRVLKWNPTKCQLISQIGVIFSKSEVWKHNGKKKNMKFMKLSEYWCSLIKKEYNSYSDKVSEIEIDKKIKKIYEKQLLFFRSSNGYNR